MLPPGRLHRILRAVVWHAIVSDATARGMMCRGMCVRYISATSRHTAACSSTPPPSPTSSLLDQRGQSPRIDGLHLIPDFLSAEEQSAAVSELCAHIARTTPSASPAGGRRIYNLHGESDIQRTLPYVSWLLARVVSADGSLGLPAMRPPNALQLNDYDPDGGCQLHVDARSIGDTICMFSLMSPCIMTLAPESAVAEAAEAVHREHRERRARESSAGTAASVDPAASIEADVFSRITPSARQIRLDGGSLLVLAGEARREWAHGIARGRSHVDGAGERVVRARRLSLVFWRTLNATAGGWSVRRSSNSALRMTDPSTLPPARRIL